MRTLGKHLSYANVVATFALLFAMSGGALAANHYLITKSSQIKPSLLKKLKGSTGAAGPQGIPGSQGPGGKEGSAGKEGPKGASGPSGVSAYQVVEGAPVKGSGTGLNVAFAFAKCPSGTSVLGGGFHVTTGADGEIFVADNGPNGSTEWESRLTSGSTSSYTAVAFAICATVSS
jgi:hypothetical protein